MYIPLFNKTNYSLLSSLLKVDDLVEYAKNNNLPKMSIVDTNMFATMEFIKKCEKNNIKPVIGLEIETDEFNIVLFAKDYIGYKSLIKLSTIQNETKVTKDDLQKYNKNIIAVISFINRNFYDELTSIYDEIYLGYKNKQEEKESLIITKNIIFFRENLYLEKKDQDILTYLYRIRDGKTITDDNNYDIENHELNIKNILDLTDNEGLLNIQKIINNCYIEFSTSKNLLPIYECDDPKTYLFELCKTGLKKRLNGTIPDNYKKRLIYELTVINEMGFPNYFLVVYDYIKYAKKNNILVGPGRGSAAGSLVAYSLGITDIDPIKYDLLFERFLNPERKTMPDIDTDFPDDKRDLVIEYVKNKYGTKRVSGIITFGTMASKQVIRDVSRTLNIPLYKVDSLCKLITSSKETLKEIYETNETFRTRIDSDTILKNMFEIAIKLEGFPRHTSKHAAGIVMSQIDLDEVIPLIKVDNMYLTSYPMEYLEELGLLKMDFLALKNLTIINNIITDIKETYNVDINFSQIPLNDEKTLKIFEEANTCGIFQFESPGMKNFLKKLKPSSIEDIFAAIALFRPGAALNIDTYIKRKHNQEEVKYLDDSLEQITKQTYGILIYQEQIMQLANIYAGYTLGEADILRRAMSKKKLELLQQEKEKFIRKSIENNHEEKKAKEIFDLVLNFAGYGFNKSHSVVYSIIAYKMAYLKAHYPNVFFSNLLTNVIGSEAKTNEYIIEVKSNNIEIEKPTINNSSNIYKIINNKIIYPISNIKGIGNVIASLIQEEKEKGPFFDIFKCFSRLYIKGINKKTFETLIYADVFKEFNYNRKTLIENLDNLYNYAELTKDLDEELIIKPELENKKDYDQVYLLEKEKEVFGFYLSSHPTTIYKKDNPNCINLNEIKNYFDKVIETLVLVEKIKVIDTKKGDKMAFLTGSDSTCSKEFILFPKTYKKYESIEKNKLIKITGKVEKRLDEYQIIVEQINNLQGEKNE